MGFKVLLWGNIGNIIGVLCVAYASPHEDTFAAGK